MGIANLKDDNMVYVERDVVCKSRSSNNFLWCKGWNVVLNGSQNYCLKGLAWIIIGGKDANMLWNYCTKV